MQGVKSPFWSGLPYEHLAEVASELPVNELLSASKLRQTAQSGQCLSWVSNWNEDRQKHAYYHNISAVIIPRRDGTGNDLCRNIAKHTVGLSFTGALAFNWSVKKSFRGRRRKETEKRRKTEKISRDIVRKLYLQIHVRIDGHQVACVTTTPERGRTSANGVQLRDHKTKQKNHNNACFSLTKGNPKPFPHKPHSQAKTQRKQRIASAAERAFELEGKRATRCTSSPRDQPLYSMPHFSFTMTGFPVKSLRNGFGLTGTVCQAGAQENNHISHTPSRAQYGTRQASKQAGYGLEEIAVTHRHRFPLQVLQVQLRRVRVRKFPERATSTLP